MTWRGDQLGRIAGSEELQITTRRPDGTQRRWTPIWVVRVGDALYIRSAGGRGSDWYRHATQHNSRRIRAGGIETDAAQQPVEDPALVAHVHHREMNEYGLPPPTNAYRTGPAGWETRSGLVPPRLPAALPPSENCRPNRNERREAARSRGPPGRCSSGWSALGRIRAVREITIPPENADSPVTPTATCSVRPSNRVSIGTLPGNSASGGSHGCCRRGGRGSRTDKSSKNPIAPALTCRRAVASK
jgi:hypothetical protein